MRQSVTFENGHCVRHTVTKIHHEARRPSRNVQRRDSLDGGHVESLKHDLRHALSVGLGVQKSVRGQNGMFFRCNPEFVVGRLMQDSLHVVTRRKGAQYLYPALGWRLRSHRWAWSTSEVDHWGLLRGRHATHGGNTHLRKDTLSIPGL